MGKPISSWAEDSLMLSSNKSPKRSLSCIRQSTAWRLCHLFITCVPRKLITPVYRSYLVSNVRRVISKYQCLIQYWQVCWLFKNWGSRLWGLEEEYSVEKLAYAWRYSLLPFTSLHGRPARHDVMPCTNFDGHWTQFALFDDDTMHQCNFKPCLSPSEAWNHFNG